MAADVTLVSIPADRFYDTPVGQLSARQIVEVWNEKILFDDEHWMLNDDGEPLFLIHNDWPEVGQSESKRQKFKDWFWDQFGYTFDSVEVGPWSPMKAGLFGDPERYLPGPTVAVAHALAEAKLITPALRARVMNLMSYPDRSMYGRTFSRRGTGHGKYKWRGSRNPARNRRQVKNWLNEHMGEIVFAQSW